MDTISPSTHSPASVSLPVSPDDDSRFDRTASPSPACPKETLQQCGVSRIVEIHVPFLTGNSHDPSGSRSLLNFLEQAAALGYNTLHLASGGLTSKTHTTHTQATPANDLILHPNLEHLTTSSRTLGYHNTITTSLLSQPAARLLQHLDHINITIGGKPETHDQRSDFARLLENLAIVKNHFNNFGFTHSLHKDSWQILPWLTDFAIHHKATHLHLSTHTATTWSPIDLYRIFISHYYLKTFAEPELFIQLDLLHRDDIINNPNLFFPHSNDSTIDFSTRFGQLTIDDKGDIFPIARSAFFKLGNIHDTAPLSTTIDQFMEEKLPYVMQLYNDTYREILADPGVEVFSWHQLITDKSKKFGDAPHSQR